MECSLNSYSTTVIKVTGNEFIDDFLINQGIKWFSHRIQVNGWRLFATRIKRTDIRFGNNIIVVTIKKTGLPVPILRNRIRLVYTLPDAQIKKGQIAPFLLFFDPVNYSAFLESCIWTRISCESFLIF
jgi:hypothetical protein